MPVTGQELVAKNIIKFRRGFLTSVNSAMKNVADLLDVQVTLNMSLMDHSLEDLTKLGSPYSTRYGSKGLGLHDPYYQVHIQSGTLLASKKMGIVEADINGGTLKATAYVGLDKSLAAHAAMVIYGTSKMIPRPVLEGSRLEVKNQAVEIIRSRLKNLRFNFEE